jgi:uncharacterized protein YjbJ (UPF0337 family)
MGVMETAKGKAKEAAGAVTDNDTLRAEGQAQADKGREELKETEARAKAKAHEEKAAVHEKKQELAEDSK